MKNTMERMRLFGFAQGADAGEIRTILCRLLEAGKLRMGHLQAARDIIGHCGKTDDATVANLYLLLSAMFLAVAEGNSFLRTGKGSQYLKRALWGEDDSGADPAVMELVDRHWPMAEASFSALPARIAVRMDDGFFFAKHAGDVREIRDKLSRLVAKGAIAARSEEEIDSAMQFGFEPSPEQRAAVKMASERQFSVITGGPGTGKTTIVCALLRVLLSDGAICGGDVALVAPTGRAAQRMGEALSRQCEGAAGLSDAMKAEISSMKGQTIHSLLGGYPPNWRHNAQNPLSHKLVIVDESSMIDIHLMRALLDALGGDCRLVLLGDKNQLPSVSEGAVLGDIVASGAQCTCGLVESHRFKGRIKAAAEAVNRGDARGLFLETEALPAGAWQGMFSGREGENRCFRLEGGKGFVEAAAIDAWASHFGLCSPEKRGGLVSLASDFSPELPAQERESAARAIFSALDESKILCVAGAGELGAEWINHRLARRRYGGRDPSNPLAKPGVPVMIVRNTPSKNLWNGDIGVTVRGRNGMDVIFPFGGGMIRCSASLLPEYALAYAITVHKSQGSEFGNAMVVLPKNIDSPLLTRSILYTGITRAKKRALILGPEQVLEKAVERETKRDSGIVLSPE